MHIVDILRTKDEDLFKEYQNSNISETLNNDDINYIIRIGRQDILRFKRFNMNYECKIEIWDKCRIYLFTQDDYIKMILDKVSEDRIIYYMIDNIASTRVLYTAYNANYHGVMKYIINSCKIKMTITDQSMVSFGIYLHNNGCSVIFEDMNLSSMILLLDNNMLGNVRNTTLYLDPLEFDNLIMYKECRIMELIPHIHITPIILMYICQYYPHYLTSLDSYVSYDIAMQCTEYILSFLSYKYLMRLYYETGSQIVLEKIIYRKDIPNSYIIILNKLMFDRILLLLYKLDYTVTIFLNDEYTHEQYLELHKYIREKNPIINISDNNTNIPNLLCKLESSDNIDVSSFNYMSSVKLIRYCSRLFPLGTKRFYEKYVLNGTRLMQYYYDNILHNLFNHYSYDEQLSDVMIVSNV